MADEEHVALLKQGVEVWNKWRKENPDVGRTCTGGPARREPEPGEPGGANLRGANLGEANLSGADLSRADLSGANLSAAAKRVPYLQILILLTQRD